MQHQVQTLGMAWFEREDYEAFRSVLSDRHWHDTFDHWEATAKQELERLQHQGIRAVKANVRSDAFVAWCHSTGRNVDTKALLAFANEAAYREIIGRQ